MHNGFDTTNNNSYQYSFVDSGSQFPYCIVLTGTENVSSIWNSAGSDTSHFIRVDNRFKNIFNKSRFSPVTFDTWNTGHILQIQRKIN